jgi:peptide/nickel transport system ATP-binding protein
MYAGRIVERAPTRVLFDGRRHPYTDGLLASIPRLTTPSHTPLHAIPGRPPDLVGLGPGCAFAPRCPAATGRCRTEQPTLEAVGLDHEVACFNPLAVRLPAAAAVVA